MRGYVASIVFLEEAVLLVRQGGRRLSQSWNFTASTTDPHLEPDDPDGEIIDARWFDWARAAELLALHRYDPIREPAIRFLKGDRELHWTFELTDDIADRPSFRWEPPHSGSLSQRRPRTPSRSCLGPWGGRS